MSAKPLIFIVAQQSALIEPLKRCLAKDIELAVFPTGEAYLQSHRARRFACGVIDMELPGMSGMQLQSHLHAAGPGFPIVAVTEHATWEETLLSYQRGAIRVLPKPVKTEELRAAVQLAIALEEKRREAEAGRERKLERLTSRERQILAQLIDDKPTRQIARELGISPSTVEKHRARILLKARVNSVVGLVKFCLADSPSSCPAPHLALKYNTCPRHTAVDQAD